MKTENNAASAEQRAATKSIWLRGLVAPAVIALVTAIIGVSAGAFPALAFLALAGGLLVAFYLTQITKLYRWASGPLDRPVPGGAGPYEQAFYALHRRVRARTGQQHDVSSALADLRDASEALPDGMVILDAEHRIEWNNRQATAHLGVRAPDDSGRPLVNLVRQPEFSAFLASAELGERLQMASARDPGVILSLQIIPYAGRRKLLISRDITRFERAETMRRDFIANVSHELRTPLTVLIGYLEMLHGQKLDAGASKSAVESMGTQAQAMQRLVEDLLTLSSLESPQNVLREEPVEMAPLLEQVYADGVDLSDGRHRISLENSGPPLLIGAAAELSSAFSNLVSNAIRYTPNGGIVTLRWQAQKGEAVFSVDDTGVGVAPSDIPRLTERFYRVDRGRSRQTGGTGLGLAIVKHVVTRHQGALEITSELGKGSRFSIRFQAARVKAAIASGDMPIQ